MDRLSFRIGALRGVHRWFVTAFVVVLTAGYLCGIYFVAYTTHGTPTGTVHQFRGNEEVPIEEAQEIKYEKSDLEMLNIIHSHTTSFSLIFFALGGLFLFTAYPERLKAVLSVEPFVATVLLFGGMAGIRYLPETWALPAGIVMMVAGLSTFAAVVAMAVLLLWELWRPRRAS